MNLWYHQRKIFVALGVIIRVDFPQAFIQQSNKLSFIAWRMFKLYYPFMRPFIPVMVKVNWSSCKIGNGSSSGITCRSNCFFGIFYDDFLAEGIDEMFGSSGDPYPEGGQ